MAYFAMFIMAFKISGAHFNPATSLAVFIQEKTMKNLPGFLFTMLAQLTGAYLGIALSYLLIKDYLFNYTLLPNLTNGLYISGMLDVYWGRLIVQEAIQTFLFTLAYLVVAFEPSLSKIDRVLKGLTLALVLMAVLFMTEGSGGCLNPALAIA
jgi:glycerol uptake facilitator-like aquaporin